MKEMKFTNFIFIFQFNPSSVYPEHIWPRTPDTAPRHFLTTRENPEDKACFCEILNNFFEKGRNSQSYLFQKKRTKKLKKENLNYYTCRISIQGGKNRRIKTQTKYIREQQTERKKKQKCFHTV